MDCMCSGEYICKGCYEDQVSIHTYEIIWSNFTDGTRHKMGVLCDESIADAMMQDIFSKWIEIEEYLLDRGHNVSVHLKEVGVQA